ncbi:MAG: NAD(P)-dependent oxidoreductase [Myxococcales bacterium]|nr:NAD(P)-dependent oxidoreductase [Myxococcales bacterium]
MHVAFLGLGTMGAPMARRLASRFSLSVYNRSAHRAEPFAALGARVCATPREAVERADVVCTMLADPAALRAVSDGPDGALASLRAGSVWVELSTVGTDALDALRAALTPRGVLLVDAPVSGSRIPAEEGALVVLAGGPCDAIAIVEPVLQVFGTVRRTGGPNSGAATKLVLNQLGAHMLAGLVSGLVLGTKLGLDPRELLASIDASAFRAGMYAHKGARIVDGRFEPADFAVDLLLKDQELVLEAARRSGVSLPTLESVRDLIARAVAEGEGDKDLCAVVRVLERVAGVMARAPSKSGATHGYETREAAYSTTGTGGA